MQAFKSITLLIAILFASYMTAGVRPPKKDEKRGKGVRLGFGPMLGFYSVNKNHSKAVVPKTGVIVSFRKETRFGRDYKTFFLWGVDYMFHGLTFQSYYFATDSLKLYDKKFTYKYALYVQEINVPFQVKYALRRENNSLFSPFFMIGYHLRCMLPGNLKVTQNGKEIIKDNPQIKFKNFIGTEQLNAFLSASFGFQKNSTGSKKGGFFVELNYRYGFSPFYFSTNYAANSLFINSSHVMLLMGIKF